MENGNDGSSCWAEAERIAKKIQKDNPSTIILLSLISIDIRLLQNVFAGEKLNKPEGSANSFNHNDCLIIHLLGSDSKLFQIVIDFIYEVLSSNF